MTGIYVVHYASLRVTVAPEHCGEAVVGRSLTKKPVYFDGLAFMGRFGFRPFSRSHRSMNDSHQQSCGNTFAGDVSDDQRRSPSSVEYVIEIAGNFICGLVFNGYLNPTR
jgi:hypothetical protein